MSQEVHRDSRGVKLEPGGEIHFGQAVVKFEMESNSVDRTAWINSRLRARYFMRNK